MLGPQPHTTDDVIYFSEVTFFYRKMSGDGPFGKLSFAKTRDGVVKKIPSKQKCKADLILEVCIIAG